MTARDATRYIRSITRRPEPEHFRPIPDPTDFEREMRLAKCWLPTPEQIAAECKLIREEKGDVAEVKAAISELLSEDIEWEFDEE